MAAKAAIRDVGRAMGLAYSTVDNIAKQIPNELNITLDRALKRSSEFKTLYDTDSEARELIDMARRVEGMPRHASTHAAGVVITRDEVSSYVPLAVNDESVVTQFTMTNLEALGLLKMDFLGLRTLTVIDDTIKMIRRRNPGGIGRAGEEGAARKFRTGGLYWNEPFCDHVQNVLLGAEVYGIVSE